MGRQWENKAVLGIALLYTVIISILTLLQKINIAVFSNDTIRNKIYWFLRRNTLWIIVMTAIIIILSIYIKKSNQKVSILISDNPIIGIVVGALVVLKGISDLASSIPGNIISIESVFEAIRHIDVFLDGTKERMILKTIVTNVISLVIILCQIILGIFLFKVFKKKVD